MIGIIDQRAAGLVSRRFLYCGRSDGMPASTRLDRSIATSIAANAAASGLSEEGRGSVGRFCFLTFLLSDVLVIAVIAQCIKAAREPDSGRGGGDTPPGPQHRMRAGKLVGRCVQIHFGVVEDEVFERNKCAGEREAGADVVEMHAGIKTVAEGLACSFRRDGRRRPRRRRPPGESGP